MCEGRQQLGLSGRHGVHLVLPVDKTTQTFRGSPLAGRYALLLVWHRLVGSYDASVVGGGVHEQEGVGGQLDELRAAFPMNNSLSPVISSKTNNCAVRSGNASNRLQFLVLCNLFHFLTCP